MWNNFIRGKKKKTVNFSISLYQREACVAATGVSGVAVPAARWHEKERRHRCERCDATAVVVNLTVPVLVLACRCRCAATGGRTEAG